MKRTMALFLALVLVIGMAALPVSAEAVESEEELVMGEMEVVTVYGEEEPIMGETTTVTVYGEEETGFFGWLKNLWNTILNFFGL